MPRVRTRIEDWLLALLALRHGRTVDRSWLAGTLWPDSEESRALSNLRDILVYLRKALGSESGRLLSPTRDTLTLDLEGAEVDLVRFDRAIKGGEEEALHRAVEAYSGPLLEGCLEEWVFPERASREQECLRALENLADMAEQRQDYALALSLVYRAKAMDGLRDSTQRALMRVLAATGDVPAALSLYRQYRSRLREEMNVEPDAETVELYQQIRQQAANQTTGKREKPNSQGPTPNPPFPPRAAASPFPLAVLPHPITSLIGREQETGEIVAALSRSRLVTLVGGGGVGKTRLAIEVADRQTANSDWETAYVALAPLLDPALLPTFVANALGIREEAGKDPALLLNAITSRLSTQQLLLVLDNCEHLIDAAASLAQNLLDRCPDLHLLATSRQRLGVTGEITWRVPSLPVPDVKQLPTALPEANAAALAFPAIRLFVERASSASKEFQLTRREEVEAVCRICRRLDGIPLAIELAAARVGPLTLEDIHNRLDQRFRLLTGGSRAALPRQQTLRSLIDWSYDLLSEAEKALLRRLSVFSGGWMLEAAEAICTGDTVEDWEILDLLTGLVDKSLVVAETLGARVRYRFLETIKQYARDRLPESTEAEKWHGRHLHYYLALAEEAAPHLRGPQQQAWLERLEWEHDNLRQGLDYCLEGPEQIAAGLRLAGSLQHFWQVRGYLSEGRKYCAALLTHPRAGERTSARANALNGAGILAQFQGDYAAARSLYEECLAINQEMGDRRGVARALNNLGGTAFRQRDYAKANALYEEALQIHREIGNRLLESYNLIGLGMVAFTQGDYASACPQYEQALAISRELGDKGSIANSLHNLGDIIQSQGDFASSCPLYEESLAIRRELGDRRGVAGSLTVLGDVFNSQGNYEKAQSLYEEALQIHREIGVRFLEGYNLASLGMIALSQGDHARARPLSEQALAISRESGDRWGIAHSTHNLAGVAQDLGEFAEARTLYQKALAIQRELGHKPGIAASLCSLGNVAQYLGEYAEARTFYVQSLAMIRELGNRQGIAELVEGCAGLAVSQSNPVRAARLWGVAVQLRVQIGTPMPPNERSRHEAQVAAARAALANDAVFDTAWAEGRAMTIEQAIEFTLSEAAASRF